MLTQKQQPKKHRGWNQLWQGTNYNQSWTDLIETIIKTQN